MTISENDDIFSISHYLFEMYRNTLGIHAKFYPEKYCSATEQQLLQYFKNNIQKPLSQEIYV